MEIVTGSTGQVHVTPIDDAVRNGNPGYLKDKIIIDYLDKFAATIVSNSYVRVSSGYGMNQGRIFKINSGDYDNVPIENGAQGYKRADLIVARYSMDVQTGFESMELVAIKGAAGSTYVDPSYMTGDINGNIISSDFHDDFPLYRVRINGTTLEGLDRLFTPVPDGGRLGELEAKVTAHINAFNALNFRTNLASEATALPKNGANVRPGVEGTLPVSHGGTGQTTLKAAGDSIIGGLGDNNTAPTDSTVFIGSTPNTSGFQKKTMASLWTYLTGKIRTLLGMGTNNVVPISHGGTGKTSITNNNVLVGNAGGGFDEWGIDTAPSSANAKKLITSKGVADALGSAGYGDMMKSTYDPNNDGIIAVGQGGTGANTVAGARNALGLGNTSGALPIANGGTGAASVAAARNNLGLGNTAGALPIANGGTGAASVAAARNNLGLGNTAGALPVANGGTGATSASAARTNLGVPPTNHASTATTYGIGNASNYGHVKLTDSYTSTSAASSGVAASAKALKSLHDIMPNYDLTIAKLQEDIEYIEDSYMSKGGGTFTGNITVYVGGTTGRLTLGNSTETSAPSGKGSTGHLRIYCDYTARADVYANSDMNGSKTIILPKNGGTLALDTSSSRRVKENIKDMTEERAKKILDLDVVNFDYIGDFGGGLKDQSGVIAEDVIKIIPEAVDIAKRYDETKPIDERTNPAPSVDYRKFVPYLIKMVQMQQKEIEELKKR